MSFVIPVLVFTVLFIRDRIRVFAPTSVQKGHDPIIMR